MAVAARRGIRQALARQWPACKARDVAQCGGSCRSYDRHCSDRPTAWQGFVRRQAPWFLHRREIFQITGSKVHPSVLFGDVLREQLQSMKINNAKNRLCIEDANPSKGQLSVEDARRLLRLVQLEALKTKLNEIPSDRIPYRELIRLCMDSTWNSSSEEEAMGFVKSLDESGQILILGHMVYLRPHQVARAIESALPLCVPLQDDPRRRELERMEKQKEEIDARAQRLVRRELWAGLGFLSLQTVAFMRLTFWELSWDVMEPICFFVTSIYFLAGYAFFLRTSRDPSFEGFFEARLQAKQSRLMKKKKFDIEKFKELQRICKIRSKPSVTGGILDLLEEH